MEQKKEKRNERARILMLAALACVSLLGLTVSPSVEAGWGVWAMAAAAWLVNILAGWLALRLTVKWEAEGKLPSLSRYLGED